MTKKSNLRLLSVLLALAMFVSLVPASVFAAENEDTKPAALNIGYPVFKNVELLDDVYNLNALGVSYGSSDIMMDIYKADLAAGGDSFYMDRVLARTGVANTSAGSNGNADGNTFLTRGRALYMYTSTPSVIGFGGNTAYHQPLTGNMYSITFTSNGSSLRTSEQTATRVNMPSNWTSNYTVGGSNNLVAHVTKFISQQNVAVTAISLENVTEEAKTVTVNVASGFVTDRSTVEIAGEEVPELVGKVSSPSNLTTITTRLTGNGFGYSTAAGTMTRDVTVPAGESVDLKVVMAFTTEEIPESTEDYVRFSELSNLEAIRAQKAEYNLFWAENVPYIDLPKKAVQKAVDYRWWSERFNSLDANIPGYDYQYPITIEGVLGYNNAIALTQPMHLQDTKWLRDGKLALGQLLSVGNSSQSSAFLDNPGNRGNWNNHYGQYIADAGLEAFNVIGGGAELAENLAYYFGHDATGQLEHYGNHIAGRSLIAYRNNYMTGNDADTISMNSRTGVGTWKVHGENAYVWAAANAAAELYTMLGDTAKADEYTALANKIQQDVLDLLWCEQDEKFETYGVSPNYTGSNLAQHNANQRNLIKLTESNNYNYYAVGLVPTDAASIAKYKVALKTFTNGEEFPIFPMYTANQVDNKVVAGSNNFSNINFTVQARAYEAAIRTYDKEQEYVTSDMLAMMTEWMAWLIYPTSGDIRYPNNSEYYNMDGKTLDNYYRSWIYHNILGNYNYIFFEDMAGIQPRADEKIELFPIDFSYDHFMVNNLRYHGHDMTIAWDKPGDEVNYYGLPEGYSLYIDGSLALTLGELGHVVFDPATGTVEFPDGAVQVLTNNGGFNIPTSMNTVIENEEVLAMMEKAGIHGMTNLAEGAAVTATFTPSTARAASWAEKHRADGSDSTSKAVNEMKPDPQAVTDGTTVNMPFWGNDGSKNSKDSLILDLGEEKEIDMATLYFYNDRQNNGYSEPSKYSVEYWNGTEWVSVSNQSRTPAVPKANYNLVTFNAVTTSKMRFTFTNKDSNFTAVTEIQLFDEGGIREETGGNTAPVITLSEDTTQTGSLRTGVKVTIVDDGMPYDKDATCKWEVVAAPEGATAILSGATKTVATLSGSMGGDYTLKCTVNDGELETVAEFVVTLTAGSASGLGDDVAPGAKVESDYTSSWEKLSGINNPSFEPASSNVGTGKGWGNWSQSVGSEHYVGYTFDGPVTVGAADIYWYDDGGGTQVPSKLRIAYMDANGNWVDADISTPFASSIAKNTYNRIEFKPFTATRVRLYMTVKSGAAANGVYRFKLYASINVDHLDTVDIATMPGVMPTLPGSVNGYTDEGALISVPVTWDTLTEDMIATDGQVTLNGINSSTGKMTKATIYVRSDFDQATITSVDPVELTTPNKTVPTLPATVRVGYNDGAYDNQNVKVTWPKITADDLAVGGTYTFEGEVEGTATKALLTLHVLADPASIAVDEKIEALGEITLDSESAIAAARAAFEALTDAQKAQVTKLDELEAAEAKLAELKDAIVLAIVTQPVDYVGGIGSVAQFSVTANREDAMFQWMYSKNGGQTWSVSVLEGADTATVTVPMTALRDGQMYKCVVTDPKDELVVSEAVTMSLGTVVITAQPQSYVGAVGSTATLTVEAEGSGLTYQWFYSNDGGEKWSKSGMTGADTATLSVPMTAARVGQMYKVVVTDAKGNTAESEAASITTGTLAIVTQPADSHAVVGETAVLSVEAQGEGLTYQWMYSNNGGQSWSKSVAEGADTAEMGIAVKAFRIGQQYKCVVTDVYGNVVESAAATLLGQ